MAAFMLGEKAAPSKMFFFYSQQPCVIQGLAYSIVYNKHRGILQLSNFILLCN
jgi:hypothetical protein